MLIANWSEQPMLTSAKAYGKRLPINKYTWLLNIDTAADVDVLGGRPIKGGMSDC